MAVWARSIWSMPAPSPIVKVGSAVSTIHDYLFAGQYLPYYICDSSVIYHRRRRLAPAGTLRKRQICYVDANVSDN